MKISQTHTMKLLFWITAPTILLSLGLVSVLNWKNNTPILSHENIIPSIILLGVFLLLANLKLKWKLDTNGFEFRFFPFIYKTQFIPINEIECIEIVTIHPLKDFGGWGLRWSSKYGKAYTTTGKTVIRLTLTNGKMLNFTAFNNTQLNDLKSQLPQIK